MNQAAAVQSDVSAAGPVLTPRHRLRIIALALSILGLVVLALGVRAYCFRREWKETEAVVSRLDRTDPGWRFDQIEAGRDQLPEGKNSALVVLAVDRLIPKDWSKKRQEAAQQERNGSGVVPDWIDQLIPAEPNRQIDTASLAIIHEQLRTLAPALKLARSLAEMPRGRYPLALATNPLETRLAHLRSIDMVARLLRLDVACRAHEGDIDGALASCRATINLGRSIGDEPTMVSQLQRIDVVKGALLDLERVLGQGEASDEALKAVLSLLERERANNPMRTALRGERALLDSLYSRLASGELRSLNGSQEATFPNWARWLYMGAVYKRQQRLNLLECTSDLEIIDQTPDDWPSLAQHWLAASSPSRFNRSPMEEQVRQLLPQTFGFAHANFQNQYNLLAARAAIEGERRRLSTGRWPEKVDPSILAAAKPLYINSRAPADLVWLPVAEGIMVVLLPKATPQQPLWRNQLLQRYRTSNSRIRTQRPMGIQNYFRLWNPSKRHEPPVSDPSESSPDSPR